MGFWEGVIAGILITVISGIMLFFILPALKGSRDKFLVRLRRKPRIKTRKHKDRRLLSEIEQRLRLINQLRSFPDTPIKDIQAALYEIEEKAKLIKTKEYKDIKEKLILYSEKASKLHANILLKEMLDLLVKDGAFKLIQEIREILSP